MQSATQPSRWHIPMHSAVCTPARWLTSRARVLTMRLRDVRERWRRDGVLEGESALSAILFLTESRAGLGAEGVGLPVDGVRRFFFFQAEDGIRDYKVTGVQTCALPI